LLYHGYSSQAIDAHFDHIRFSGVVPRTFVGPVLLSLLSTPLVWLGAALGLGSGSGADKVWVLVVVRGVLGALWVWSWGVFRRSVARALTTPSSSPASSASAPAPTPPSADAWAVEVCVAVVSVTQFHGMFYASRPLPNVWAAVPVNLALAAWIERRYVCRLCCVVLRRVGLCWVVPCVVFFLFSFVAL
jgi:alpha-1,6-mannosyltransferase